MKVLLIYSRFGGDEINYVDLSFRIPLGITYLAAILRKRGFDVCIRDGIFYRSWGQFENDLEKIKPDVIGLSFTTSLKGYAFEYCRIAKKVLPESVIVAGGSHPTISPEEVLKNFNVDFIVQGEGDETFPELMSFIKKNRKSSKNNIQGLAYILDGNVIINPPRCMNPDLDKLPWPARDLLPMKKYLRNAPLMPLPYPSTNILVSKGCPGNCLFCQPTLRKLTGNKVRYRRVDDILKEIKFLIKKYHIKSIDLGVDEPTYNREWMIKFSEGIIREKIKIKWGLASRVDTVDMEMLRKMTKAGCIYISYGIESGSQKIMDILRKGTKVEQAEKALKWAAEAGICGRANIMVGSPGETKETIQETIDFIKRAKPDFIFVAATTPLYGTDLYTLAKKEGLLRFENHIGGYDIGNLKLKDLTTEEVEESLNKILNQYKGEFLFYFLNPFMVLKKLHLIKAVLFYWLALLSNPKELFKWVPYYLFYGRHIQTKKDGE